MSQRVRTIRDIGELRWRITIQKRTQTSDGAGGKTNAWSTHKTVWAKIENIGGENQDTLKQRTDIERKRFIIRYDSSITSVMRILYDSMVYIFDSSPDNVENMGMYMSIETTGRGLEPTA